MAQYINASNPIKPKKKKRKTSGKGMKKNKVIPASEKNKKPWTAK